MRALLLAARPTHRSLTSAGGAGTLLRARAASASMATMSCSAEANPVVVVYVTCPDAAACDKVIDAVIGKDRLAACVNIVPGITSVYRWKGEVQRDAETLLIMKTTRACLEKLQDAVIAAHPYETPEVLALEAVGGSAAYLKWVADETGPVGGER